MLDKTISLMDNILAEKFVTKIWTKSHTYTVTPFKYFIGFD